MKYRNLVSLALSAVALICATSADAAGVTTADIQHMSMAQKHAVQQYFRAHSFDFPKNFSHYHPGPYWILHHAAAFQLTPAQTREEMRLKMGMARSTVADNRVLQQRYAQYHRDSAAATPSERVILADIHAIGVAQTTLAGEMVPYHLKSYAALDAREQALYRKLVAARK